MNNFTEDVSIIFCAVQTIVQTVLLQRLLYAQPKKGYFILFTALNFAAHICPLPLTAGIFFSVMSIIFCCCFSFGMNINESVLYGILSSEIMWLCCGLSASLLSSLNFLINEFKSKNTGIIFMTTGNILTVAAYLIIYRSAHRIIKNEHTYKQNTMIILVPLTLIFAVEIYIVKVLYITADTDSPIGYNIRLLVLQALGTASIFCILYAYKKCADNFRIHEKMQLYEQEQHYCRQYTDEILSYYETARSLRHDYRNHILIIGGLLNKKQYDEAVNYISKLDTTIQSSELKYRTGCRILDILLTAKLSEIDGGIININCTAVPEIDETDICTVFSNALDNAVHALSELNGNTKKFISVTSAKRGDFFLVEIENSFNGKDFRFGTGIKNIIRTAEKYGGTAKITAHENVFALKIIVCNPHH